MKEITTITSGKVPDIRGLAQAVRVPVSHLVCLSGQPPIDLQFQTQGSSYEEQTRAAFGNVLNVLESAELSVEDIVKVTCYVVGLNIDSAIKVSGTLAELGLPERAQTIIGAASLAGDDGLIEIEAMALILTSMAIT